MFIPGNNVLSSEGFSYFATLAICLYQTQPTSAAAEWRGEVGGASNLLTWLRLTKFTVSSCCTWAVIDSHYENNFCNISNIPQIENVKVVLDKRIVIYKGTEF